MPFVAVKSDNGRWKLKKPDGTFAKPSFLTKQSALNAGLNWMRYKHEKPKIKGNKIVKSKT